MMMYVSFICSFVSPSQARWGPLLLSLTFAPSFSLLHTDLSLSCKWQRVLVLFTTINIKRTCTIFKRKLRDKRSVIAENKFAAPKRTRRKFSVKHSERKLEHKKVPRMSVKSKSEIKGGKRRKKKFSNSFSLSLCLLRNWLQVEITGFDRLPLN
jgi:hypothetical protein